jgi:hypothetical protein
MLFVIIISNIVLPSTLLTFLAVVLRVTNCFFFNDSTFQFFSPLPPVCHLSSFPFLPVSLFLLSLIFSFLLLCVYVF